MKKDIKEVFDKTCNLFDEIDKKACIMEKANSNGKLSHILKYELMAFLMCLSAADNRISRVEAQLIREYFEVELYPIHIKETIKENRIGSKEYFERIPESLKLALQLDNILFEQNIANEKALCEIILELFKVLGKEMIVANNKVTLEEQSVWSTYITMMTRYVVKNAKVIPEEVERIIRPGKPIEVDYEMSLNKIGRIYTLYKGKIV